ncbi:MAG: SCO family protein [Gemmatimonadaceae bacterium]
MTRPIVALALGLLLAACTSEPPPAAYSGMVLTPARGKPDFTFTSTRGNAYDFRKETDGSVTLLFFGYTYCPDVCPMHMANIAAVLKKLDYADRQRVKVVFVTTDPDRDTPERLRSWLAQIDSSFVGVAGPPQQIAALQQSLGLAPARPEPAPAGAPPNNYGVSHAAVVLAFTPDDSLRVLYPFGVRQQDWAKDIPLLLRVKARG